MFLNLFICEVKIFMTEIATKEVALNIPSVDDWTLTDLRKCCRKNKVKGYAKFSREQLILAVKDVIRQFTEGTEDEHRKTDAAKEKLKKVALGINNLLAENNCSIGVELKSGEIRQLLIDHDTNMMARITDGLKKVAR